LAKEVLGKIRISFIRMYRFLLVALLFGKIIKNNRKIFKKEEGKSEK
jgi:hypothetical protein